MNRHGLARTEVHVANDPDLSFSQYVPEAPLPPSGVATPTSLCAPVILSATPVDEGVRNPVPVLDIASPSAVRKDDEWQEDKPDIGDGGESRAESELKDGGLTSEDQQPTNQDNGSGVSGGSGAHATGSDGGVNGGRSSTPVTPVRIHPPVPIVNLAGTPLDAHAASVIAQWQARWPKVYTFVSDCPDCTTVNVSVGTCSHPSSQSDNPLCQKQCVACGAAKTTLVSQFHADKKPNEGRGGDG